MSTLGTRGRPTLNTASIEAHRALVRRVVSSATFGKSERLSSFLVCICDLTLSGRAGEINEQKIGTAVFGRPVDYDSTIDGIVRPQASRLRQRLDTFFSGEGSNEPVRIVLPRGSYVPVFENNPEKQSEVHTSDVEPDTLPSIDPIVVSAPSESFAVYPKRRWILLVALILVALPVGIWTVRRATARVGAQPAPDSHPLWSVLFRPNQRTIVVPSDTGFVMWQSATHQNIGLSGYLSGRYRAQSAGDVPKGQIDPEDLASRRYTSIVDLGIVRQLTRISDARKGDLTLAYARDLRVDDLKETNVVLIGASVSNPWVELFEPQMNFVFSDARLRKYTVLNRASKQGEPSSWTANYDDSQHLVYGVVSFLSNLGRTGNVLIVEGTSMAGTQAAWDFVADNSSLLPFLNSIRRKDGSIPHFQLVLESTNVTGSAVTRRLVAWRVTD